jgi:hypothetical protein
VQQVDEYRRLAPFVDAAPAYAAQGAGVRLGVSSDSMLETVLVVRLHRCRSCAVGRRWFKTFPPCMHWARVH